MRIFKYALKNIIRNSFLSFSSILVIALMAFFINVLLFVEFVTGTIVTGVSDKISLSLNLKSGYEETNSEVIGLEAEMTPIVGKENIRYISSTEAFETLKKRDPELAKVIENDKENPLPSSLVVRNIPLSSYDAFDTAVVKYKSILQYDAKDGKKTILDYRGQFDRVRSLANLLVSVRYGIYGVIALFVFAVAALVYQSIGNSVFYFREEIRIIGLVGGSASFVYGPFAIQWLLYGAAGWILGFFSFFVLAKGVNFSLIENFSVFMNTFLSSRIDAFGWEILILAVAGILSGFLSSYRFARMGLSGGTK